MKPLPRSQLARALPLLLACAGCSEPFRHVEDASPRPAGSPVQLAQSARATDHFATASGDLAIVPLAHASLLFVWHGLAIYVDPASPTIDDASLPAADAALVTDAHYDHFDPFALSKLRKGETVVLGPRTASATTPAVARPPIDAVVHEGDRRELAQGLEVTAVAAYGLARGPGPGMLYHPPGQALGYVLDFDGTRVYVSGDTECTPEMRALDKVDVAFVSMNVPYAMTPDEASACVAAFRPKVVFPYAYRHAPSSALDRARLGRGIDVRRRDFYPLAAQYRAQAYRAFAAGQWGNADDRLDEAKRVDPAGEQDWRVRWTRQWLREYERPWPW